MTILVLMMIALCGAAWAVEAKKSVLETIREAVARTADRVDAALPFADIRHENLAKQPSFGAEMTAMGREFVNDVRGTLHSVFYGQPEHPQGMGVPLSPTPQLITEALKGVEVDPKTDQIKQNEPHVTVHGPQTTIDKLRSFAEERAGVAFDKMENAHKQPERQKEQDGLER